MSRWFRHYAGMMRDEKLVSAAIKCKQPIERVLWVWGAILESAAEIDDNGKYELDPAEVAYFLRSDEGDISGILAALSGMGRIADGVVVKWGNRQFSSDRSRDRVAAFRERKRAEIRHPDEPVTGGNDDVTLPKRHGNAPETETETDIPLSNDNGPIDPEKLMFDSGVLLITSCGKSEGSARSWLGKAKKAHGAEAVITAIARAKREGSIDPIPYMEAVLRGRARASPEFSAPC